jgi:proteic killer suppression protein
MRIAGFRHKGLKRFYETGDGRGIRADLVTKVELIIHAIEQARHVAQVGRFPGWKLHRLKGDRREEWSVWVTGNYRLTYMTSILRTITESRCIRLCP